MSNINNVEISVVVPFFNDMANFPRLCISLNDYADRPDVEILIVDDCSETEQSEALANACFALKWSNIKVISCEKNGGASKARRIGIGAAKGEYIAFLDSDDGWAKGKLDAQLACMRKHHAVISGNPCVQVTEDEFKCLRNESVEQFSAEKYSAVLSIFSNRFSTPSVMLRTDVARANPFDDRLRYSEDSDCWRRVIVSHGGIVLSGANSYMFKHAYADGGSTLSSHTWKMSVGQFSSLFHFISNSDVALRFRLLVPFAFIWSAMKALRREVLKRLH